MKEVSTKKRKNKKSIVYQNKIFAWIALATAIILTIPFLAMQFDWVKPDPNNPVDQGVNWTLMDFVVAGVLLFGMTSLCVLVMRQIDKKYWLWAIVAFFLLLVWAWTELAVGLLANLFS